MAPVAPTNGRPWPGTKVEFRDEGQIVVGTVDDYDYTFHSHTFPVVFRSPRTGAPITTLRLVSDVYVPGTLARRSTVEQPAKRSA